MIIVIYKICRRIFAVVIISPKGKSLLCDTMGCDTNRQSVRLFS